MVLFIPVVIWGKDMGMSAMIENKPFLAFFIGVAAISLPISFAAVPFGLSDGYRGAAYQICEAEILSVDHSVCLPGVQV